MPQLQSFLYALSGLKYLFKTQVNARFHALIAIVVSILGFVLDVSSIEWCIILLCFAGVISLEAINTSIESLCNTLHPEKNIGIKITKDVAAGAVLFFSIITIIIGLIIFFPKIHEKLQMIL